MKMECFRRRSRYNRLSSLEGSDDEEDQDQKIAVLGGDQTHSHVKYYMKNVMLTKLHQKIVTSFTLLKKLRDAYVEVMHSLAENVMQLNNGNSYLLIKKPPRASSKVVTSLRK
ncbi:hypothetical protein RchiOBHm_Chr7g0179341 [Rosa chinensis]|uniref:Uncharacterized protein n=1 Tax=Rosa chinensis TaxID=74649 RepID=A0A2P6P235_ROSCH|nr:hypothetical protein RchiOBHm_Chr7g0179341 [Rosa chinensis]